MSKEYKLSYTASEIDEKLGKVDNIVTYTPQTLTEEQQAQARENVGLTVFGVPYTSATQVIDISMASDGSVKLYLFTTSDGYDAVVTGTGAIADFGHMELNSRGEEIFVLEERPYNVNAIIRLHIEDGITSIGNGFMYKAYSLKHLSFEDSKAITHLGIRAFAYTSICGEYEFTGITDTKLDRPFMHCTKLAGLTFSNAVTEITECAFQMCIALRTVNGISNVTTIGDAAFQYCTSLESIDVVPGNVTLGNWVFILAPNGAKAGNTVLAEAPWKASGALCFAQNEWTADQLSAIRAVTGPSVQMPIPESDNQGTDFYNQWGVFPYVYDGTDKGTYGGYGHPASGCCGIFSLYHIYNILHPNAQYDTFYDWMMRGVVSHKITVTQSLHDTLAGCNYGQRLMEGNTDVSYEVGSEITARDLPMALDLECETWGDEGTSFWGCCQAMGWKATEMLFDGSAECGANVKRTILNNLAANKPVEMEIVGAGVVGNVSGHGMHAVVAIGYDAETDKLLIIDSTGGFDADIVPLVYWCSFENLITPHASSAIWTFDFGSDFNKYGFRTYCGLNTYSDFSDTFKIGAPNGAKMVKIQNMANPESLITPYGAGRCPISNAVASVNNISNGVDLYGPNATAWYTTDLSAYGMGIVPGSTGLLFDNSEDVKLTLLEASRATLGFKGNYMWTAYYWDE